MKYQNKLRPKTLRPRSPQRQFPIFQPKYDMTRSLINFQTTQFQSSIAQTQQNFNQTKIGINFNISASQLQQSYSVSDHECDKLFTFTNNNLNDLKIVTDLKKVYSKASLFSSQVSSQSPELQIYPSYKPTTATRNYCYYKTLTDSQFQATSKESYKFTFDERKQQILKIFRREKKLLKGLILPQDIQNFDVFIDFDDQKGIMKNNDNLLDQKMTQFLYKQRREVDLIFGENSGIFKYIALLKWQKQIQHQQVIFLVEETPVERIMNLIDWAINYCKVNI